VTATTAAVSTSTPYDPESESDPLIAAHITRQSGTGRIVFKVRPYAVGAVVLHLRAPNGGRALARREFPELPEQALDAALRFAELHPEHVSRYL